MIDIYVDGSPGTKDSFGLVAMVNRSVIIVNRVNRATNNMLEYKAVWHALQRAPRDKECTIYSDSELIVNHLNEEYKCKKQDLITAKERIVQYIKQNDLDVKFVWIARDKNPAGKILSKNLRTLLKMAQREDS